MLEQTGKEIAAKMERLRGNIQSAIVRRKLNATGRTAASIRTNTITTANTIDSRLYANENWITTGSGTPPRSGVTAETIERWADAKGVSVNAYATARSINRRGSKAYRENQPNVFLDEIQKAFTGSGQFAEIQSALGQDAFSVVVPELRKFGKKG